MKKGGLKEYAVGRKDVFLVPPDLLNEEPGFNARLEYTGIEEFADFICENGVLALSPLRVYRKEENLFISDGHRRIRGVRLAQTRGIEVKGVPCMNDPGNEESRTFGLITNNAGAPLTKLEQGMVCIRLTGFGYTQTEIAKKIGKSLAYVNQCIALGTAPKKVQDFLVSGVVNDSTVLTMLGNVEDPAQIYDIIVQSVEDVKSCGGNGNQRDVAHAVRNRLGKETVSTRIKKLDGWIEENSIVLKADPKYRMICSVRSFLSGQSALEDLLK